jgi:hypothetical protein
MWNAPVSSSDGKVTILNMGNILSVDDANYQMQAIDNPPRLGSWLLSVGKAYRFATDKPANDMAVLFNYLKRDVPEGQEFGLAVYYLDEADPNANWLRLPTFLNQDLNVASANVPGDGVYVLISTIEMPPLALGWNAFGYPVPGERSVSAALASIAGQYTTIYGDVPTTTTSVTRTWQIYDSTVIETAPKLTYFVNNLDRLKFGEGYWIRTTTPVTPYFGVATDTTRASALSLNAPQPPMTLYGWFTPTAEVSATVGTAIEAYIGEAFCGQTTLQSLAGDLAYRLFIASQTAIGNNNCGQNGLTVTLKLGSLTIAEQMWDTSQAHYLTLPQVVTEPVATYSLDITTVGTGTVSVEPEQATYEAGSVVTLTAVASNSAFFAGWTGDVTSADNPLVITLTQNTVLTATFTAEAPITYTLTMDVVGNGSVLPGTGSQISGTSVSLQATPDPGWQFDGWTGAINDTTNPILLLMDGDKVVTATFSQPNNTTGNIYLPLVLK